MDEERRRGLRYYTRPAALPGSTTAHPDSRAAGVSTGRLSGVSLGSIGGEPPALFPDVGKV